MIASYIEFVWMCRSIASGVEYRLIVRTVFSKMVERCVSKLGDKYIRRHFVKRLEKFLFYKCFYLCGSFKQLLTVCDCLCKKGNNCNGFTWWWKTKV